MSARYVVGLDGTSTFHAVEKGMVPRERLRPEPAPAVCGAEPFTNGADVAPWPPYAKGPVHYTRCRECWELTGKPRPHPYWAQWRTEDLTIRRIVDEHANPRRT